MSSEAVVIVTGAARGIGAAIAARFASDGAIVQAFDREFPDGGGDPPVTDRGAGGITPIRCDITSDDDVRTAVDGVLSRHGRVDVLVNNAGINVAGPLATADLTAVHRLFDINVVSLLRVCQAVIPAMQEAGRGRIINAASFAAIIPAIGGGAYAASKSAVVQLSRTLAGELGPWDITVNSYAPGMVPTGMNGFAELPHETQDELLDTLTLRRWSTPEDIAGVVAFLAGPDAAYITGTLVDVSGGKLATQLPARAR